MRKHECLVIVKGTTKDFIVSKSHYEANKDHLEFSGKDIGEITGDESSKPVAEKMTKPATKNKMATKPKATK